MAFKGITFAGQNVTPKNDGGLYGAHYGDGILWGCSMNLSGDDLVIQSGEFIMCGRYVQVDGATNVDLSGRTLQTGYIQVIMNADLTQGEGNQWYPTFVESATTTFPALTQDDINDTGTLYQVELAIVQISAGNLNAVYSSMPYSSLRSQNSLYINNNDADPTIYLGDSGNTSHGVVSATTSGQAVRISNYLNGAYQSGLLMLDTGNSVLFGNGGSLYLRPNGANSSTGALTLDTSGNLYVTGQVVGGATITNKASTGSTSVTAGTYKNLSSASIGAGIYLIKAMASFTRASSTATVFRIGCAGSNNALGPNSTEFYFAAETISRTVTWTGFWNATGATTVYFNVYSGAVNATVTQWNFDYIRIA